MSHQNTSHWTISMGLWLLCLSAGCSEAGDSLAGTGTLSEPAHAGSVDAGGAAGDGANDGLPDGGPGVQVDAGESGLGPQAGAGGGGGTAAGSGGGSADAGEPAPCVRGAVSGSQLVFIGDSFIAAPTSNIAYELEALMMQAGSSAYSTTPRFRQVVGATMAAISMQYDTEHGLDPDIKVVVGNGGGNDVLVTDRSCLTQAPPANAGCAATVKNAVDGAAALLAKAEADGVEHFVYFFYPHEPLAGLYQGVAPAINDSLDYAEPMARAVCESSPICTFVSF